MLSGLHYTTFEGAVLTCHPQDQKICWKKKKRSSCCTLVQGLNTAQVMATDDAEILHWKILSNHPNTPDLVTSDFHFFGPLRALKERRNSLKKKKKNYRSTSCGSYDNKPMYNAYG